MQLSFPVILFFIFLVLKLAGVIAWSWLWVFSPLWISLIVGVVFFLVIGRSAMKLHRSITRDFRDF